MPTKRIVYIDVLRIFLTCLVVAHHAAQAYGPTGGVWVVNDPAKAQWLGKFFFVNASYMMGLYFFISGYFMLFSIRRKTTGEFVKDRLFRLGIPLLFFTFFVFLPFNYLLSAPKTNVLQFFLDTYFHKPPIATGHLWFVASLLFYSFIYLLLFGQQRESVSGKPQAPFRNYYIFIYIILLAIVSALVRLYYPIDVWRTWLIPVEVAHIPQYLSMFLIGALFNRYGWLESLSKTTGWLVLCMAIIVYLLSYRLPDPIQQYWLTSSLVESFLCVGISMGLLTVFRQFVNHPNALVDQLSASTYGIYLFHLLIVIFFQSIFLNWQAGANTKFLIVTLLSILASFILTSLLRRIRFIGRMI